MHNKLPTFFYFIDILEKEHIRNLDKRVSIIYRNYYIKYEKKLVLDIKKICKKNGRKLYLANNLKLAIKLDLDGVYLPSFNKKLSINIKNKKKFKIIGSAHSVQEMKIKEKQGAELIFLSPLFKNIKNKKFLDVVKFNFLASQTKIKTIALGGITSKNLNKLKMTNTYGFAGISYFKENYKVQL